MTDSALHFIVEALDKLERSVENAARALTVSKDANQGVVERIAAYREIVRRQRSLLADLADASRRKDWREVSRISSLVHGSSLMINVDAGFLIKRLKSSDARSHA